MVKQANNLFRAQADFTTLASRPRPLTMGLERRDGGEINVKTSEASRKCMAIQYFIFATGGGGGAGGA